MNNFHTVADISAIIAFISYLMLVMLVGVISYMATRSLSDYVLGGRSLGGAVAALSAGASDMSSWLLMSLPGAVYASGMNQIWIAIGLTTGAYLCWRLIAKRLRVYSEIANDSVTLPAFLDNRFRDNTRVIRIIAAVVTLIFFIFYVAAGFYAGGILISRTFGISYTEGLYIGALVIMLYTSIGGFLAVSWTDFFQGTLMLFVLLLVPYFAMKGMGGFEESLQKLLEKQPDYFSVTADLNLMKFISLMSWGLGYFGMPHILVRFMSVKSVKEIPLARRICISWMSLSMLGAILVGIVGAINFCHCPLDNQETVFIVLSESIFAPWIMGIILAVILSSSMCAVDSQMLAASSALTEDFYRVILRKNASQKELLWVGRIMCLIIALCGIGLAKTPNQSIMNLVSFAWAGLGATFGAPVVLSLYWKRATRNGIAAGMVAGALTVIVWHLSGLGTVLYELLPATLMAYLFSVGVSLLDKQPAPNIIEEFNLVEKLVREDEVNLGSKIHYRTQ